MARAPEDLHESPQVGHVDQALVEAIATTVMWPVLALALGIGAVSLASVFALPAVLGAALAYALSHAAGHGIARSSRNAIRALIIGAGITVAVVFLTVMPAAVSLG